MNRQEISDIIKTTVEQPTEFWYGDPCSHSPRDTMSEVVDCNIYGLICDVFTWTHCHRCGHEWGNMYRKTFGVIN